MALPTVQVGDRDIALDIPKEKASSVSAPSGRSPGDGTRVGVFGENSPGISRVRSAAPDNVESAVAGVLEAPLEFPPLRRALTPDDHLAIVIREDSAGFIPALTATLRHVRTAGVNLENVTLLAPPEFLKTGASWHSRLPADVAGSPLEAHDPATSRMAYLASTKAGRRIYLNRTLVDADQVIVVGPARFDSYFGVASGLADLFPAFSDQATRQELFRLPQMPSSDARQHFPLWDEAHAVGWLLGMPFVVTILESHGDQVLGVAAGGAAPVHQQMAAALRESHQLTVEEPADLVIGTISAATERQSFAHVAQAALFGSRVVRHGGALVILSQAGPQLPPGADRMRRATQPSAGLSRVRQDPQISMLPWWQLATALAQARVFVHGRFSPEELEELSLIPLEEPEQTQQLIRAAQSVLLIEDLHLTLPTLQ